MISALTGELRRVDAPRVALLRLLEEVRDRAGAVVLGDEGAQRLRKLLLLGKLQPGLSVIATPIGTRPNAGCRMGLAISSFIRH